jgi:hypothetical protein
LHVDDLESKRFEDLIRQLAYEFKTWRRLEATGRSGSDDGFDARGLEIVAGEPERFPDGERAGGAGADAQEEASETRDRLWLIQCKREKSIGPAKLIGYLDGIKLDPKERLYGIVFCAPCDFSKPARDQFFERCRALGIQECQLWGKAEIEDLLLQPKNDHLLFAYFGASLVIRQRAVQTALRRDIATKKRLKSTLERDGNDVLIIRNANGDIYPKLPVPTEPFAQNHWRLCHFERLSHDGLEVELASFMAYLDGENWDAADASILRHSYLHLSRGHFKDSDEQKQAYQAAQKLWLSIDENKRAWLNIKIRIPYDRILAIDDTGDQFFDLPQVYCVYDESGYPSARSVVVVKPFRPWKGGGLLVQRNDPRRIAHFPPEARRKFETPAETQSIA